MKTYILRDPDVVEPQIQSLDSHTDAAAAAITAEILAPHLPVVSKHRLILFIGLDVHTESIAVSLAPSDSSEIRRYGLIGGGHDDVLKLAKN